MIGRDLTAVQHVSFQDGWPVPAISAGGFGPPGYYATVQRPISLWQRSGVAYSEVSL